MRRFWPLAGLIVVVICLALAGCAPEEAPAESYLAPYAPGLRRWTPQEEAEWALLPRYEIAATLDVEALELQGQEKVRFTNREDEELRDIYFRLYPNLPQQGGRLTVRSVTANGVPVNFETAAADTALRIKCDPPVAPHQVVELEIAFSASIPDVEEGWVLFGRGENIISLPDFYPILAVYNAYGWHWDIPPAFADAGFADAA